MNFCYEMCNYAFHSPIQPVCHFWSDQRVTSVVEDEHSLVSGCLNTAIFTTLLDLASPFQYDRMSMLFLNENSDGDLKGDQRET